MLTDRDAKLALLNAGDSVTLRFDARELPPVPNGMVRRFFFYSVGWDRDADYNVVGGSNVLPLPGQDESPVAADGSEAAPWRLKYNTRWVPGDRFQR